MDTAVDQSSTRKITLGDINDNAKALLKVLQNELDSLELEIVKEEMKEDS